MSSFVRVGHPVVLHTYNPVIDLPAGVEISDAGRIIPADQIIRHRETGSYALFSDIFRYRLLAKGAEIYVDCDVFCVRPIERRDFLFGYESDELIGSAILSIPGDSELLKMLDAAIENPSENIPWLSRTYARRRLKRFYRRPKIEDLPWGSIGPRAVTHCVKALGLTTLAAAIDEFYPVHCMQVGLLYDPGLTLDDLITPRTKCVHLFNEMHRRLNYPEIPPSSPLGRILAG